ncbi:hypothetical protein ACJU26_08905 [Acidithiobacillus sp. M4-SHS-6]|uniref:hypothetical protein n=1 Tax=Acidithiobacillus sp. M4-SHS-6 TaxID=3383024 RepID=UPI0039BDC8B0
MKIFDYVFIILGIIFIGYVMLGLKTDDGMGAIDHFCQPVHWAGNVAVSIAAEVDPHAEAVTQSSLNRLHYSCEYIGWRLFFEKRYEAWKKAQRAKQETQAYRSRTLARYRGATVNPGVSN